MKAISLLQPWASLIIMGVKKFETRSWNTNHRGQILIHSSKRMDEAGMSLCMTNQDFNKYIGLREFYNLPFGAVIGSVDLQWTADTLVVSEDIRAGNVKGVELEELSFGDYSPGRKAFRMTDPLKFQTPIPFKGALSIWEFPDELLKVTNEKIHLPG